MSHSEFKTRYDPDKGRYVRKHIYDDGLIYGEGITDVMRSIGSKVFGKTMKKITKKAVTKAGTKAAEKTGEFVGNKAGDKIIQLLSKKKPIEQPQLNDSNINDRVNRLISGGKTRKLNFI